MTKMAKIKYSEIVSEQHKAVGVCSPTTGAGVLQSIQWPNLGVEDNGIGFDFRQVPRLCQCNRTHPVFCPNTYRGQAAEERSWPFTSIQCRGLRKTRAILQFPPYGVIAWCLFQHTEKFAFMHNCMIIKLQNEGSEGQLAWSSYQFLFEFEAIGIPLTARSVLWNSCVIPLVFVSSLQITVVWIYYEDY